MSEANKKRMNTVVEFIVAFLIDRTGNEFFDKWYERRKIKRILSEDSRNIKRIFYTIEGTDLYNLVEEFIIFSAFIEATYYSPAKLTEEQADRLWKSFKEYIHKETGDTYIEESYRNRIIECINLHNEAINNIIMDTKSGMQFKFIKAQNESIEDLLKCVINTLNTETRLQDKEVELDFGIEQLESIMKSYRFDINQLRRTQVISMCGTTLIILLMSISIPLSLKFVENSYAIYFIFLFFAFVGSLLISYWRYISRKLYGLEKTMEEIRYSVWQLHYALYKSQLEEIYENYYIQKNNE